MKNEYLQRNPMWLVWRNVTGHAVWKIIHPNERAEIFEGSN